MSKPTLTTIDLFLDDDNYEFIDIREISECVTSGMIEGFKILPFYSLLKAGEAFYPIDYTFKDWAFNDIEAFKKHFDSDKTQVLICNSGNRTQALKKALDFLGYDCIDIGGIIDYKGKHLMKPKLN
ncbi:MAG: rhodanese-like domain-containing protein [Candidatus Izemoplasmataceae bacterium]